MLSFYQHHMATNNSKKNVEKQTNEKREGDDVRLSNGPDDTSTRKQFCKRVMSTITTITTIIPHTRIEMEQICLMRERKKESRKKKE